MSNENAWMRSPTHWSSIGEKRKEQISNEPPYNGDDRYLPLNKVEGYNDYLKYKFINILGEHEKSILLKFDCGPKLWIPKSSCCINGFVVYIPKWFLKRKHIKESYALDNI